MGIRVQHLVLDSGAFIRGYHLQHLAHKFYSVREVIEEIRDKETKQLLASLPFEITFTDAPQLDVKHVIDFSKKTGDYESLSAVDIKLLALTSYLQRIHVNEDHLGREPRKGTVVNGSHATGELIGLNPEEEAGEEEGWICPENVADVSAKMKNLQFGFDDGESVVTVACMTSDYAMQNVLLQMGLRLMSVDESRVIRRTNQYILRCFACGKTTDNMSKKFCPQCGNGGTLKRVSVTINESGEKEIHINFNRPISVKGTNKPIPAPKGGKHSANPVLVEDQPVPQQKPCRKALIEKKVTGTSIVDDPDYVLRSNPFAVNDVHSRAAKHNYVPRRRGNK